MTTPPPKLAYEYFMMMDTMAVTAAITSRASTKRSMFYSFLDKEVRRAVARCLALDPFDPAACQRSFSRFSVFFEVRSASRDLVARILSAKRIVVPMVNFNLYSNYFGKYVS